MNFCILSICMGKWGDRDLYTAGIHVGDVNPY
jgi:hypothetical protein